MKCENNVMRRVATYHNVKKAIKKSQKRKKNTYGCRLFNKNYTKNYHRVVKTLKEGTFHTSDYETFTIKADHGKIRDISKLPYDPDRIVHHAIVNVIGKKRIRSFIRDTFCCIKGRGLMGGTNRLQQALNKFPNETKYCLQIDLKKFFPSVSPKILSREFHRLYKDKEFLNLIDDIIFSVPSGLPIGSLTSQLMSNIYLSPLDHYIKDKLGVKFYYRYCDDIVVLSNSKGYLKWILREIKKFASEHLNLIVKDTVQLFEVDKIGIDFLGYRFFHFYRLLRKSIKKQFCRSMKSAKSPKRKQEVLASYKGWCQHGNCRRLWYLQTGLNTYDLPNPNKKSPKNKKKVKQQTISRSERRRKAFLQRLAECEEIMYNELERAHRLYVGTD